MIIHTFSPSSVQHETATLIAGYLAQQLAEHDVLLLLSGGSAISMYQEMFQLLLGQHPLLSKLTVSLLDERYVKEGSPQSNEQQLRDACIISLIENAQGHWFGYLAQKNISDQLSQSLSMGIQLIILAGMGEDGHTAGLLPTQDPETIRQVFQSDQLVEYYELPADTGNEFRKRLTATPKLMKQAHQVFLYALGDKKRTALRELLNNQSTIEKYPVLVFADVTIDICTDQALA